MLLKKKIPMKYVLGKIKFELILVSVYALVFEAFIYYYDNEAINIPIAIPTIVGTIISLLLAFKSNQAYDRWWEARIIWGAIVNDSRSLIRQVITFYKDPNFSVEANDFKDNFAKRQIAWCYSLSYSLRDKDPYKSVKKILNEEDFQYVKKHKHVPNAILMLHSKDLKKAYENDKINTYQQVQIDKTLTRLCDYMGKCERIKNTIFPTTYSMYIRFTLCLFIMLLPFALTELLGWLQIPLVITIGAAFFLIEKMAIHLQDPFENKPTDTPMTAICGTIEKNLFQMIHEFRDEFEILPKKTETEASVVHLEKNPYFIL